MNNLLSAGFLRLKKDKEFWIDTAGMLIISMALMLINCITALKRTEFGYVYTIDEFYFDTAPLTALFCAGFISFFVGKEYSDGTIRNKLIVGYTRTQVYMSNFIVSLAVCEGFVIMQLVGGLVGIPLLGAWTIDIKVLVIYIILQFLFTAALNGIFVMLAMLSSNKAVTTAASIILSLVLLLIGSMFYNALQEPEMISGVIMTMDGAKMGEPEPNPAYISGIQRVIYSFITDSLPTSQAIMMANWEIARPLLSAAASVVISLGTIAAGAAAFRRKDLK